MKTQPPNASPAVVFRDVVKVYHGRVKYQPDVAVLDIEMPGPGGIEVARRLKASAFPGKIVIVTTFWRPGYLRAAMAAGATGFLLKEGARNRADAARIAKEKGWLQHTAFPARASSRLAGR